MIESDRLKQIKNELFTEKQSQYFNEEEKDYMISLYSNNWEIFTKEVKINNRKFIEVYHYNYFDILDNISLYRNSLLKKRYTEEQINKMVFKQYTNEIKYISKYAYENNITYTLNDVKNKYGITIMKVNNTFIFNEKLFKP